MPSNLARPTSALAFASLSLALGAATAQTQMADTPSAVRSVQGKLLLTWGMARIENVPEGAADLKVRWHPEQLGDQPAQKLQVPAATLETAAQPNFSPTARRVRVSDSGPAASNPS